MQLDFRTLSPVLCHLSYPIPSRGCGPCPTAFPAHVSDILLSPFAFHTAGMQALFRPMGLIGGVRAIQLLQLHSHLRERDRQGRFNSVDCARAENRSPNYTKIDRSVISCTHSYFVLPFKRKSLERSWNSVWFCSFFFSLVRA